MGVSKSRQYDLEELYNLRKKAVNSTERDMYDMAIGKIMRESGATRSVREDLIMAIRHDDIRAIKYFNNKLDLIKAHEQGIKTLQ